MDDLSLQGNVVAVAAERGHHFSKTPRHRMLDLAPHIVEQKAGNFEPDKFQDQYETALVDLINPEAGRQADNIEGAATWRERCRPDGGAAPQRWRRSS
jgi:non-homologous end joining protein Ku